MYLQKFLCRALHKQCIFQMALMLMSAQPACVRHKTPYPPTQHQAATFPLITADASLLSPCPFCRSTPTCYRPFLHLVTQNEPLKMNVKTVYSFPAFFFSLGVFFFPANVCRVLVLCQELFQVLGMRQWLRQSFQPLDS